jgi:hypothetical protein
MKSRIELIPDQNTYKIYAYNGLKNCRFNIDKYDFEQDKNGAFYLLVDENHPVFKRLRPSFEKAILELNATIPWGWSFKKLCKKICIKL